ncbi:MAG: hypothetical protein QG568_514 [Patescibacteria group bacterium]|nr:hypothetical protein [Patescibacteria group bacterium]
MKSNNPPNPFTQFIRELVKNPKYQIAEIKDAFENPRLFTNDEAEKLSLSRNALLIFEINRKWEFYPLFFFLPWFREVIVTPKLIAVIQRPRIECDKPPKVMCFDANFFDHLGILKANGLPLDHKMCEVVDALTSAGYVWH